MVKENLARRSQIGDNQENGIKFIMYIFISDVGIVKIKYKRFINCLIFIYTYSMHQLLHNFSIQFLRTWQCLMNSWKEKHSQTL